MEALQRGAEELQGQLAAGSEEQARLAAAVAAGEAERGELAQRAAAAAAQLESLQGQLAAASTGGESARLSHLAESLAAKEAEAVELGEAVAALERENSSLEAQVGWGPGHPGASEGWRVACGIACCRRTAAASLLPLVVRHCAKQWRACHQAACALALRRARDAPGMLALPPGGPHTLVPPCSPHRRTR